LATNVLSNSSGAIEGEKDGGLELGLGTLDFGFCDVVGEAGPFAESKVDEIIETGDNVSDEVDTPETSKRLVSACLV